MMSTSTGFRVLVADLVKRPGSARSIVVDAPLGDLPVGGSRLAGEGVIHLELDLERILEGLVVRGTIGADWVGSCGRCLRSVSGHLTVGVDELFEREPVEGETYLLGHDEIDLEPLARDAIGLELPLVPLCRDDCAGLCPECGIDRNEAECDCVAEASDPRWDALSALRFTDPDARDERAPN